MSDYKHTKISGRVSTLYAQCPLSSNVLRYVRLLVQRDNEAVEGFQVPRDRTIEEERLVHLSITAFLSMFPLYQNQNLVN